MQTTGPRLFGIGLANLLTFARILAVPLILVSLFMPIVSGAWLAIGLFLFAAITDFFDGWVARKFNQQSDIGRMLDPIADKLLVGIVLLVIVARGTVFDWHIVAAAIILFREIFISGMREFLAEKSITVHVTKLAKWKTTLQMVALGLVLYVPLEPGLIFIALGALWLAALLTLYTGLEYFVKALPNLK